MLTANRISPATHQLARRAAWEAFAHFGMGAGAISDDANDVTTIVADTTIPAVESANYIRHPGISIKRRDESHFEPYGATRQEHGLVFRFPDQTSTHCFCKPPSNTGSSYSSLVRREQ